MVAAERPISSKAADANDRTIGTTREHSHLKCSNTSALRASEMIEAVRSSAVASLLARVWSTLLFTTTADDLHLAPRLGTNVAVLMALITC